jgi:putative ABC transport system substrate-binding protein
MNRRDTVLAFLALCAAPPAAHAQPGQSSVRIGFLFSGSASGTDHVLQALKLRLRELGYVEGKTAVFEIGFAEGKLERLPAIAAGLLRQKPDLIFAFGTPASLAAKAATSTIPIVIFGVGDPVGTGLVASLARPGGNITGAGSLGRDLSGKLVELLVQVEPGIRQFAVLLNPDNPSAEPQLKETESVAHSLGLQLQRLNARNLAEIDAGFADAAKARSTGLVVMPDGVFLGQRRHIADLAIKLRLASVYGRREYVEAGGLVSYGPSYREGIRIAVGQADRILKGAKPAALPVQQPTIVELVINQQTARALGLTLPQSLLQRVDEVIQ